MSLFVRGREEHVLKNGQLLQYWTYRSEVDQKERTDNFTYKRLKILSRKGELILKKVNRQGRKVHCIQDIIGASWKFKDPPAV